MRIFPSLPVASLSLIAFACSAGGGDVDGDADTGGGTPGSGGTAAGVGGTLGDGDGDLPGTGGSTPGDGDGDLGTGGSPGGPTGFVCPAGSELEVLDLVGKTPTPITGIPQPANNWFLEGPVWIDGALYASQIQEFGDPSPANMLKYTPGGAVEEVVPLSGTNGLAVNAAGLIVGASHKVGGLVTFDPASPSTTETTIVSEYNGAKFNSPNDLTIRSDGTIYFTDPTWQCNGCTNQPVKGTYQVAPDGTISLLTVLQDNPNGIALSPNEDVLYVGGNSLASYPVNADGSIGTGAAFGAGFFQNSDGMTVDCAGNVYVTTGDASVKVFSSAGADLGTITAAGARNVAFGGPNNTTLFIVGIGDGPGVMYSVELNVPGFPY